MRTAGKYLGLTGATVLMVAVAPLVWVRVELAASLPDYAGELMLTGLTADVTIERDHLGVVSIRSSSRLDEARALGFVHAQERFFQMDLLRRSAAGELAALVGSAALGQDRSRRIHQLRLTAERVVSEATVDEFQWLEAYADGVNAGLGALDSKPFEYWLLRQSPAPWQPADSILAIGAMYFDLQDAKASGKHAELVARSVLPAPVADLLYPVTTRWDAPVEGEPGAPATIPAAAIYDLRRLPATIFASLDDSVGLRNAEKAPVLVGSNNWAVAGSRSATGGGIVANDPHLSLQTPSIWFRVSLVRDGTRVTGASLPGLPIVVIGSNDRVAWGFTNSYGDWTDLVALDIDPGNPDRYRTRDGWATMETIVSSIEVAGDDPVPFEFEQTQYGPVLGHLPDGRPYAVRWVGHEPHGYGLAFAGMGRVRDAREALSLAQASGLPAQNIVVADRAGNIGWTIAGPIPRRVRSGRHSDSSAGPAWAGWLTPAEYPLIFNPPEGLIWTANGRVVDGDMLAQIGDSNFALGARAGQIRDRLRTIEAATLDDMLAIQLDDEARFLRPWRDQLLLLLATETDPLLEAVRSEVVDWGGHAAVDSVGYRLVRGWRLLMIDRMIAALTAEVRNVDHDWTYFSFREEHWAWPLVDEEPPHLLDPRFDSWHQFKLDVLSQLLRDVLGVGTPQELAGQTWGEVNRVSVRHPLSQVVPALSRWLDMPARELPGDNFMPRVQTTIYGASARFAVSPGADEPGYFHMPGGQSGNPLSPYYGAGHADWAAGRAVSFEPGPAERILRLRPDEQGLASTDLLD